MLLIIDSSVLPSIISTTLHITCVTQAATAGYEETGLSYSLLSHSVGGHITKNRNKLFAGLVQANIGIICNNDPDRPRIIQTFFTFQPF